MMCSFYLRLEINCVKLKKMLKFPELSNIFLTHAYADDARRCKTKRKFSLSLETPLAGRWASVGLNFYDMPSKLYALNWSIILLFLSKSNDFYLFLSLLVTAMQKWTTFQKCDSRSHNYRRLYRATSHK